MIVDSAISVLVGPSDKQKLRLLETTRASLQEGIEQLQDGCYVGDIGNSVEKVLKKAALGIVRDLVGHGVGHKVHEEPNIPNYGLKGTGPKLKAGMTVAIEPMATIGDERVYIDQDGWTVKTVDNSLSSHFEQTVLVTTDGYEILTPFL
jgi:methionyl aminopeptidase